MIVLFLIFVPVRKGDIFDSTEDGKDQIIGFVSGKKMNINIKQEGSWIKTKSKKPIIKLYEILGILTRKSFKII